MKVQKFAPDGTLIFEQEYPDPPAPQITAEEAVSAYFSPYQIAALSRLEMALLQAGRPLGPKMTAAKQWLEGVMLSWAMDPTPQESFGQPQATFAEASAEAVAGLQANPET
jgi:hypothetical protein